MKTVQSFYAVSTKHGKIFTQNIKIDIVKNWNRLLWVKIKRLLHEPFICSACVWQRKFAKLHVQVHLTCSTYYLLPHQGIFLFEAVEWAKPFYAKHYTLFLTKSQSPPFARLMLTISKLIFLAFKGHFVSVLDLYVGRPLNVVFNAVEFSKC